MKAFSLLLCLFTTAQSRRVIEYRKGCEKPPELHRGCYTSVSDHSRCIETSLEGASFDGTSPIAPKTQILAKCFNGTKLFGSHLLTCSRFGNWSYADTPICVSCCSLPPMNTINNVPVGYYVINDERVTDLQAECLRDGDKVKVVCNRGYRQTSPGELTCIGEVLNGKINTCEKIECCDPPENVPRGFYSMARKKLTRKLIGSRCHPLGTTISTNCREGFRFHPNTSLKHIECMHNSEWSKPSSCIPGTPDECCSQPSDVVNGYYSYSNGTKISNINNICFSNGQILHINCNPLQKSEYDGKLIKCEKSNYAFQVLAFNDTTVQCLPDETRAKKCCEAPPALETGIYRHKGRVILNSDLKKRCFSHLDSLEIVCNEGYKTSEVPLISCINGLQWSNRLKCTYTGEIARYANEVNFLTYLVIIGISILVYLAIFIPVFILKGYNC